MPVTVSHAKSNPIADWSGTVTVANSTGGTVTMEASSMVRPSDWNSAHVNTFAITGSEIASLFNFGGGLSSTTAAGGITVGMNSDPWFEPFPHFNTASTQMLLSSMSYGTWYLDGPYEFDQALGSGQINAFIAMPANFLGGAVYSAAATGSVTRTATQWINLAIYTLGTGASSTRLGTFWTLQLSMLATNEMRLNTANTSSGTLSNYLTLSFPAQWDSSGGMTFSSTTASSTSNLSTSTMASTRYDSLISSAGAYMSGSFMMPFGLSTSIPAGIYWLGRMFNSSTASAGTSGGIGALGTYFGQGSVLGMVEHLGNAYKRLGSSSSNSSTNFAPFHGYLATSTSLATAVIATSDIRGTTGRLYWNYWQSSY